MAQRTGYWGGPESWAEPVDDADPTGGRHAFDRDAALTPIFTTLRRTPRRPHLRPVPSDRRPPADRLDPQTAPIPIVRPLYAVDPQQPYGRGPAGRPYQSPADGYGQSGALPPPTSVLDAAGPSPTETTAWWRSPVGFPPVLGRGGPRPVRHRLVHDDPALDQDDREPYEDGGHAAVRDAAAGYDPGYQALPYDGGPYDAGSYNGGLYAAGSYDAGSYDADSHDADSHDAGSYDAGLYDGGRYDGAPYHGTRYDAPGHDRAPHDRPWAARGPWGGRAPDPNLYDPVTDTGRHHRRLAPAGW